MEYLLLPRLRSVTRCAHHSRRPFNFFHLRESPTLHIYNHPHRPLHRNQRHFCVGLVFRSPFSFRRVTLGFRFFPVMTSRIILSLKKAMDPQQDGWSLAGPPRNSRALPSMNFARPRSTLNERDGDIHLNTRVEP